MLRILHALPVLPAVILVLALPVSSNAGNDPLDAKAPVPSATYQSSLAGYRRFGDEKVAPWKDANETAARIGGWRAYARDGQAGAAPGASAPAAGARPGAAASAPTGGHQGHHK